MSHTIETQVADACLLSAEMYRDRATLRLTFDRGVIVHSVLLPQIRVLNITQNFDVWACASSGQEEQLPGNELIVQLPEGRLCDPQDEVVVFIPEQLSQYASADGGRLRAALVHFTVSD